MPQPDRGIAEVMIKLVERDVESGTAKQDEWLPDEEQLRLAGHTIGEFGNTFLWGYQLALLRLPTHAFPELHQQQIEAELNRRIATLDQLLSRQPSEDP
jgi:hypothetical protein